MSSARVDVICCDIQGGISAGKSSFVLALLQDAHAFVAALELNDREHTRVHVCVAFEPVGPLQSVPRLSMGAREADGRWAPPDVPFSALVDGDEARRASLLQLLMPALLSSRDAELLNLVCHQMVDMSLGTRVKGGEVRKDVLPDEADCEQGIYTVTIEPSGTVTRDLWIIITDRNLASVGIFNALARRFNAVDARTAAALHIEWLALLKLEETQRALLAHLGIRFTDISVWLRPSPATADSYIAKRARPGEVIGADDSAFSSVSLDRAHHTWYCGEEVDGSPISRADAAECPLAPVRLILVPDVELSEGAANAELREELGYAISAAV